MNTRRLQAIHLASLLLLAVAFLTASCDQKDLVYDGEDTTLRVVFDWQLAPNSAPEGMTILFFPADSRSMSWRFDIAGRDGGNVELLSGVYDVLAFNNDLPGVDFTDTDSFNLLSASPRAINDSLTSPTGMLYSAAMTRVAVFPECDGKPGTIRLLPDSISTLYHIRLDSVSGSQRIKTATAILHGPASSVRLSTQLNSTDSCLMAATLRIADGRPDCLETTAAALGAPDVATPRFRLEVIVTTSHGRYSKSFDVTEQVLNCKPHKNVYIYIIGLTIPEADTPDGYGDDVGIEVGVDGWQQIEIIYS